MRPCPIFFIACDKITPTKGSLGEKGLLSAYHSRLQSITAEHLRWQGLETAHLSPPVSNREKGMCGPCSVSHLSDQGPDCEMPTLRVGLSTSSNQEKMSLPDMATGQPDIFYSSLRHSFQATPGHVKLTVETPCHRPGLCWEPTSGFLLQKSSAVQTILNKQNALTCVFTLYYSKMTCELNSWGS